MHSDGKLIFTLEFIVNFELKPGVELNIFGNRWILCIENRTIATLA
jgi:hypothetical protein